MKKCPGCDIKCISEAKIALDSLGFPDTAPICESCGKTIRAKLRIKRGWDRSVEVALFMLFLIIYFTGGYLWVLISFVVSRVIKGYIYCQGELVTVDE